MSGASDVTGDRSFPAIGPLLRYFQALVLLNLSSLESEEIAQNLQTVRVVKKAIPDHSGCLDL